MCIFFFKQKTAYEMRISDWSSDVCSSDLTDCAGGPDRPDDERQRFRHQLEGALCHQPAGRPFQLAQPRRRTVGQPEDLDVRRPVFPQALPRPLLCQGAESGTAAKARLRRGARPLRPAADADPRSEEHTSELQSLMRNSYAVFGLK